MKPQIPNQTPQDVFLDDMKQEQFGGFYCHRFFQKERENFLALVAQDKDSFLTVELCAPLTELTASP